MKSRACHYENSTRLFFFGGLADCLQTAVPGFVLCSHSPAAAAQKPARGELVVGLAGSVNRVHLLDAKGGGSGSVSVSAKGSGASDAAKTTIAKARRELAGAGLMFLDSRSPGQYRVRLF